MNTPRTALEELDRIDARFVSGNSVPVERAHITATEWTAIRKALSEALGDEWVSVAERTPELGDYGVLVWFSRTESAETVHVEDYFKPMTAGSNPDRSQKYTLWAYEQGVTHWRQLPPPPTSANGASE